MRPLDRALAQLLVGRAKVEQVGVVRDDHFDSGLGLSAFEGLDFLARVRLGGPLARALGENLDAIAAYLAAALERLADAARDRYVRANQRPLLITRSHRDSFRRGAPRAHRRRRDLIRNVRESEAYPRAQRTRIVTDTDTARILTDVRRLAKVMRPRVRARRMRGGVVVAATCRASIGDIGRAFERRAGSGKTFRRRDADDRVASNAGALRRPPLLRTARPPRRRDRGSRRKADRRHHDARRQGRQLRATPHRRRSARCKVLHHKPRREIARGRERSKSPARLPSMRTSCRCSSARRARPAPTRY